MVEPFSPRASFCGVPVLLSVRCPRYNGTMLRVCELEGCDESLEGMRGDARFCCERHRDRGKYRRSGRLRGRVPVGSDKPCTRCNKSPGMAEFYPSGEGMRDLMCRDCRATYMRHYMRKRLGVETKPGACPQCGGDVVGRKRTFCKKECADRAALARRREAARLRQTPSVCAVCGCDYLGHPNSRHCGAKWCSHRVGLLKRYGLQPEDWHRLLEEQQHCCSACGGEFGDETPRIDHCHTNGHVRGLLHSTCNTGIGQAHDDPEKLYGWAKYLYRDSFDLRELCAR